MPRIRSSQARRQYFKDYGKERCDTVDVSSVSSGTSTAGFGYSPLSLKQNSCAHARGNLVDFIRSPHFQYCVAIVVIINMCTVGVQTHYMATHWTLNSLPWMEDLDDMCLLFYIVEIFLRIYLEKWQFFKIGLPGWGWNYVDFILLLVQSGDSTLRKFKSIPHSEIKHFGILELRVPKHLGILDRSLRLVRVFRIVRIMHLVPSLALLLHAFGKV